MFFMFVQDSKESQYLQKVFQSLYHPYTNDYAKEPSPNGDPKGSIAQCICQKTYPWHNLKIDNWKTSLSFLGPFAYFQGAVCCFVFRELGSGSFSGSGFGLGCAWNLKEPLGCAWTGKCPEIRTIQTRNICKEIQFVYKQKSTTSTNIRTCCTIFQRHNFFGEHYFDMLNCGYRYFNTFRPTLFSFCSCCACVSQWWFGGCNIFVGNSNKNMGGYTLDRLLLQLIWATVSIECWCLRKGTWFHWFMKHKWVGFHPLYTLNKQFVFHCSSCRQDSNSEKNTSTQLVFKFWRTIGWAPKYVFSRSFKGKGIWTLKKQASCLVVSTHLRNIIYIVKLDHFPRFWWK